MRRVFADSMYRIALASPRDHWHAHAIRVSRTLHGVRIVTTEEVLSEFLAHFCQHGPAIRQASIRYVESILSDPDIVVRHQSHQTFLAGNDAVSSPPRQGLQP